MTVVRHFRRCNIILTLPNTKHISFFQPSINSWLLVLIINQINRFGNSIKIIWKITISFGIFHRHVYFTAHVKRIFEHSEISNVIPILVWWRLTTHTIWWWLKLLQPTRCQYRNSCMKWLFPQNCFTQYKQIAKKIKTRPKFFSIHNFVIFFYFYIFCFLAV